MPHLEHARVQGPGPHLGGVALDDCPGRHGGCQRLARPGRQLCAGHAAALPRQAGGAQGLVLLDRLRAEAVRRPQDGPRHLRSPRSSRRAEAPARQPSQRGAGLRSSRARARAVSPAPGAPGASRRCPPAACGTSHAGRCGRWWWPARQPPSRRRAASRRAHGLTGWPAATGAHKVLSRGRERTSTLTGLTAAVGRLQRSCRQASLELPSVVRSLAKTCTKQSGSGTAPSLRPVMQTGLLNVICTPVAHCRQLCPLLTAACCAASPTSSQWSPTACEMNCSLWSMVSLCSRLSAMVACSCPRRPCWARTPSWDRSQRGAALQGSQPADPALCKAAPQAQHVLAPVFLSRASARRLARLRYTRTQVCAWLQLPRP